MINMKEPFWQKTCLHSLRPDKAYTYMLNYRDSLDSQQFTCSDIQLLFIAYSKGIHQFAQADVGFCCMHTVKRVSFPCGS